MKYGPVLEAFRELVAAADDSVDLLRKIIDTPAPFSSFIRVFRWYVSPDTPVERLKIKKRLEGTLAAYADRFRPLPEVAAKLAARPDADEVLLALLNVMGERGGKEYDLTEVFFNWAEAKLVADGYEIRGPRRAGSDVLLDEVLPGFEKRIPADFVIFDPAGSPVLVGFAHYDSDRGGAQEDDRIGGNRDKIVQLRAYADERN